MIFTYYNELVFSDFIKDYYEKFLNIKQTIIDIETLIKEGLVLPNQENISIKINYALINEMVKIIEVANAIEDNWKKYIESIDVLNNGFVTKKLNLNNDIPFFKEAIDIIENEL